MSAPDPAGLRGKSAPRNETIDRLDDTRNLRPFGNGRTSTVFTPERRQRENRAAPDLI